jgi:regulator of replication initiation timing
VLGASGHLENTKKTDIKRFSNIVLGVVGAMSQTEQTQLMSPEEMNTAIQALMKGFEELKAAIAEMKGGSQGGETGVTGASGNTTTKQVQQLDTSELDQLKKDFTDIQAQQKILVKENERLQAEKRHATAKTIVDKLIKNKSLKDEDKDETIKYYVEKKNEDGSLVDLDLVAETLEKVPDFSENEQIVGASGNPSSGYSLQMNNNTKLDNKQVYGSTISRLYRGGSQ